MYVGMQFDNQEFHFNNPNKPDHPDSADANIIDISPEITTSPNSSEGKSSSSSAEGDSEELESEREATDEVTDLENDFPAPDLSIDSDLSDEHTEHIDHSNAASSSSEEQPGHIDPADLAHAGDSAGEEGARPGNLREMLEQQHKAGRISEKDALFLQQSQRNLETFRKKGATNPDSNTKPASPSPAPPATHSHFGAQALSSSDEGGYGGEGSEFDPTSPEALLAGLGGPKGDIRTEKELQKFAEQFMREGGISCSVCLCVCMCVCACVYLCVRPAPSLCISLYLSGHGIYQVSR